MKTEYTPKDELDWKSPSPTSPQELCKCIPSSKEILETYLCPLHSPPPVSSWEEDFYITFMKSTEPKDTLNLQDFSIENVKKFIRKVANESYMEGAKGGMSLEMIEKLNRETRNDTLDEVLAIIEDTDPMPENTKVYWGHVLRYKINSLKR